MAQESAENNKKVTKIAIVSAVGLGLLGLGIALVRKDKPIGIITNIMGFGIVGILGGVIAGNIVVSKA